MAPAEHRHTDGLEVLERAGQVEERLGAGAHRDDRVVGDGVEVGRHVAGRLGAAVDAADAAGGEHGDPGGRGQRQRRRDRRGAERPPLGDGDRQVALGDLARRPEDAVVLVGRRCPTRATPSSTAVTAGTAPPSRIAAMHRSSASRLAGDGRPRWEKIVDSSATTGSPAASAAATSADSRGSITTAAPSRDEPGDGLDVGRVRERVDHLRPLVAVPGVAEQPGVAAERRRVAADEHEHRRSRAGEGVDAGLAEPAACRVGDHDVDADVRRRVPAADLATDDLGVAVGSGCGRRRRRPTATSRWR